ncbi:MAG TPA: response regulator [Armatimonadota bacterium]|nr:response regulator [Armatimonadota bacterium]
MIRVLSVEDDETVGRYLASLLSSEFDIDLVAVVSSAAEAFGHLRQDPVDVLVLDFDLHGINGVDLLQLMTLWEREKPARPAPRILFCTGFADAEFEARARQLGAAGVVAKASMAAELRTAIRTVAAGGLWYDHGAEKAHSGIPANRWKVLVGDGQRRVWGMLADALPQVGCSVVVACNSDQLTRALAADPFDLLLLDQQLPGALAGGRLWEQLGECWPALPVLMLTHRTDLQHYRPIPSVQGVLTKPFSTREAQEAVLRVIDTQPRPRPVQPAGSPV